jgi:predicted MFS family arabinose efflux permease
MPAAWVTGMPVAGAVAAVHWRLSWLALPATTAVVALVLVRLAPPDRGAAPGRGGPAAWRRPDVARFTAAELLANAAWAGVLTYAGSLLIEGYGAPRTLVAAGLATTAAAMLPGTFVGRRRVAGAGIGALATLTLAQAVAVAALGAARPSAGVSLGLLAVMAFLNGWRSVVASAMGMDSAPDDRLTVMAMRAAANQFGYLLGAAAGGLALAAGGFPAVGATFAALFVAGALLHLAPRFVVEPRAVEAPA